MVSVCPLIAVDCGHHAWPWRLLRRLLRGWASIVSVLLWWWSLVVSVLLRRRSRLSVVVVSSVLLWRRRAAVVLLWRWISLWGRSAIATLRRWCAVATTTAVILLSGIIRHGELRGGGEWKSGVSQFW